MKKTFRISYILFICAIFVSILFYQYIQNTDSILVETMYSPVITSQSSLYITQQDKQKAEYDQMNAMANAQGILNQKLQAAKQAEVNAAMTSAAAVSAAKTASDAASASIQAKHEAAEANAIFQALVMNNVS